jgi:hypothetical protein
MENQSIQQHLDAVKVLKGMQGAEQFYVTCFSSDEGAINIPNTNKWIRKIDINNIKLAFDRKEIMDKIDN